MNTVTIIIIVILILCLGYITLLSHRVKAFRNTAQAGDYCCFFIDDDRYIGKIERINRTPEGTQVTISTRCFTEYTRDISEIYPA
jgi:hypothetical protein